MSPRSSARIGSGPSSARAASKSPRPGPGHPASAERRLLRCRNGPVGRERAEVVDAQQVAGGEAGPDARDPPRVALVLQHVPPVERIAPELPRRAEVVGRNAGDGGGPAGGVELKEVLARPHVRAVVRDVDRDVAHDGDAALARHAPHALPLAKEEELDVALVVHLLAECRVGRREGIGVAEGEVGPPLRPRPAGKVRFQRREAAPVFEPGGLPGCLPEFRQGVALCRDREVPELLPGEAQDVLLPIAHRREVHADARKLRRVLQRLGLEEPVLHQPLPER